MVKSLVAAFLLASSSFGAGFIHYIDGTNLGGSTEKAATANGATSDIAITGPGSYLVTPSAANANICTISGGAQGDVIHLRAANTDGFFMWEDCDGPDALYLNSAAPYLATTYSAISLVRGPDNWHSIGHSLNHDVDLIVESTATYGGISTTSSSLVELTPGSPGLWDVDTPAHAAYSKHWLVLFSGVLWGNTADQEMTACISTDGTTCQVYSTVHVGGGSTADTLDMKIPFTATAFVSVGAGATPTIRPLWSTDSGTATMDHIRFAAINIDHRAYN